MTTRKEKKIARPMKSGRTVNAEVARASFERALATHEQAFETFFLARLFGLSFSYDDDACVVVVDVTDFMFNPQGTLHGGIICMVLDASMGHLLKRSIGAGVTQGMNVQFFRPVGAGRIECRATFNKKGRTVNCLEARLTDDEGRLCAFGTSAWMLKTDAAPRNHQAL